MFEDNKSRILLHVTQNELEQAYSLFAQHIECWADGERENWSNTKVRTLANAFFHCCHELNFRAIEAAATRHDPDSFDFAEKVECPYPPASLTEKIEGKMRPGSIQEYAMAELLPGISARKGDLKSVVGGMLDALTGGKRKSDEDTFVDQLHDLLFDEEKGLTVKPKDPEHIPLWQAEEFGPLLTYNSEHGKSGSISAGTKVRLLQVYLDEWDQPDKQTVEAPFGNVGDGLDAKLLAFVAHLKACNDQVIKIDMGGRHQLSLREFQLRRRENRGARKPLVSHDPTTGRLVMRNSDLAELDDRNAPLCLVHLDNMQNLTSLPAGLKLDALQLVNCPSLTHLPDDLQMHWGPLELRDCPNISAIPPGVTGVEGLDAAGCTSLTDLPDSLQIFQWVDLAGSGLLHRPDWARKRFDGLELRLRGYRIEEQMIWEPEAISAEHVLTEEDTDKRRVLIEHMGVTRFVELASPMVIDEDTDVNGVKLRLLRIDLKADEPVVALSASAPSSDKTTILRVNPHIRTCSEALANLAGTDISDARHYRPEF